MFIEQFLKSIIYFTQGLPEIIYFQNNHDYSRFRFVLVTDIRIKWVLNIKICRALIPN